MEQHYEVRIVDGRLTVAGLDVDDVLDHNDRTYRQASRLHREASVRLALQAGEKIALLKYALKLRESVPVAGRVD